MQQIRYWDHCLDVQPQRTSYLPVLSCGRRALSPVDRLYLRDINNKSGDAQAISCDALGETHMAGLILAAGSVGPHGGIMLMTVVLRDSSFANLTQQHFDNVYQFKDHAEAKAYSYQEKRIMDYLVDGQKSRAIDKYSRLLCDGTTSNIGKHLQPILEDWWIKVRDRDLKWSKEVLCGAPKNAGRDYYLPHFHRFALEGVADALEVLSNHWDKEIGWESWARLEPSS